MATPGVATPGGAPSWPASRSWTPAALTVGLHLLLVLAWLIGVRGVRTHEPPQRASTWVPVRPLARPKPAPAVPRLSLPSPTRQRASTGPAAGAQPAPAASSEPEPEPGTTAQPDAASGRALPGDTLAHARAMAGKVDRELREGASPITAEPDRKWERFAEAFAAARTSGSYSATLERYEGADGVTIYRETSAGRKRCYRSGSVGGLQTGFGVADGRGAGPTPCPTGVSWTPL
ncbi:MAG: hypothetical protein JWQ80_3485 [Massilia sp.]|nr:hypothetical protein [Massilia sp.]